MRLTRRRLSLLFVGGMILGIILCLQYVGREEKKGNADIESIPAERSASPPPAAAARSAPPPSIGVDPIYQPAPTGGTLKNPEDVRKAAEKFNVPISFWGKVVDQDGNPLPGVKVRFSVRRMVTSVPGFPEYRSEPFDLFNQNDGTFSILNRRGDSLSIDSISKDGYQGASRDQRSFVYAQSPSIFAPKEDAPVLFTMVRLEADSQLERFTGRFGIPYDGTSVAIDLTTGRRTSSGQLKVSCFKESPTTVTGVGEFAWQLVLRMESGGIVVAEPKSFHEAPAEGYQQEIEYEMKPGSKWRNGIRHEYYFKTNGSIYGRLDLEISIHEEDPDAFVRLSGTINRSGSRNLEPLSMSR